MSLSEDQVSWLQSFFALCDANEAKLSAWEKNFVDDQRKRHDEYNDGLRLSPKQWNIINRIDAKLNGEGDGR